MHRYRLCRPGPRYCNRPFCPRHSGVTRGSARRAGCRNEAASWPKQGTSLVSAHGRTSAASPQATSRSAAQSPGNRRRGSQSESPLSAPEAVNKNKPVLAAVFDCRAGSGFLTAEKGCQMRLESGGDSVRETGERQRPPSRNMWSADMDTQNTDGFLYSSRFFMGESFRQRCRGCRAGAGRRGRRRAELVNSVQARTVITNDLLTLVGQ